MRRTGEKNKTVPRRKQRRARTRERKNGQQETENRQQASQTAEGKDCTGEHKPQSPCTIGEEQDPSRNVEARVGGWRGEISHGPNEDESCPMLGTLFRAARLAREKVLWNGTKPRPDILVRITEYKRYTLKHQTEFRSRPDPFR